MLWLVCLFLCFLLCMCEKGVKRAMSQQVTARTNQTVVSRRPAVSNCVPLLQHKVIPTGYSPSRTAPMWVLHKGCRPSFRNRLHQRECPHGPQFLTENLLLHGLLSTDHSSCKESAPVWPLHRLQLPSGHVTCCGVGSSMGCRGTTCITIVFFRGCRGISALAPGAPPPPSSLTLFLVSRWFFL